MRKQSKRSSVQERWAKKPRASVKHTDPIAFLHRNGHICHLSSSICCFLPSPPPFLFEHPLRISSNHLNTTLRISCLLPFDYVVLQVMDGSLSSSDLHPNPFRNLDKPKIRTFDPYSYYCTKS